MARMMILDPAPMVPLPDDTWYFLAPDAGLFAKGLRYTSQLWNGTLQHTQCLDLAYPTALADYIKIIATKCNIAQALIERAVLDLTAMVEVVLRQMDATGEKEGQPQATVLVALAMAAGAELFHTPEGEGYATIKVYGHQETWPLKVKAFRRWLARLYYDECDKSPGSQAIQDALGVLEGKALYDGPEYPVHTRIAEHNGTIYLDLANERWQAIEVTTCGWHIVDTPPVKFRRTKGMLALPEPVHGSTLATLRPFVNLASDDDWRLLVSWLVATFRPVGPYPVLVIYGEQGSAKSTQVRVLRALVDPNTAALRTTPRDERDLVIAATNGWLIALDNLSHLSDWLSDALCRLATGGGFATRELYTDADETIFTAQRPIVLNGIEEVATRGDLLDRAITLYLPTIPDDKRQDEKVFWQAFEQARPQILGALLDIVSAALLHLPTTTLSRKPRMADFALWSCAAAEACGWSGKEFLAAYQGVRDAVHELTLEASPVGPLVRDFAQQHSPWEGTASELLTALDTLAHQGGPLEDTTTQTPHAKQGVTLQAPKAGSDVTKQKGWPKNGRALSNVLRRLAPTLRAIGVDITFGDRTGKQGKRQITLNCFSEERETFDV